MTQMPGTLIIPEAAHRIPQTSLEDIDKALAELSAHKDAWLATDVEARIGILDRMISATLEVAPRWVEAACDAKGLALDSDQAGEEWGNGPVSLIRNLRLLRNTLRDISIDGRPQLPGPVATRDDGHVTAPVFPTDRYDGLLYQGFKADVWMQPGVAAADVPDTMAVQYGARRRSDGQLCFVLGAGNVSSIAPMDALYKLFVENQVVLLKVNPVNEYIGPIVGDALGELVARGFLRVIYGGAVEGAHCANHELVDALHMTGSDKTHDAIVFGPGEEGERNKQAGMAINTRPMTSELGNVTPVIVVPGPWSDRDLAFQGENLSTMIANNAGFNCVASRVIVNHGAWAKRQALLDEVRAVLGRVPQRAAYYPGAHDRFSAFVTEHPEAETFGASVDGQVPWTLIPGLDPNNTDDACFTTEAFCGVFGEVGLNAPKSVPDYIDAAVEFCNDSIWGTLSAAILVHPKSLRDPAVKAALDRALARLRYGSVVVNHWSAIAYALGSTTWGAFPGHTIYDIQSGSGVVHNTYMFDLAEKSVVQGPFRSTPKPPWFVTHKNQTDVLRRMANFEANPSLARLPGVFAAALRG